MAKKQTMIPFDLAELKKVNNMSTEQGNKLIAEFDGWECDESQPHTNYLKIPLSKEGGKAEVGKIFWGTFYKENFTPTSILSLKYHSSWDWLKPVIDKIFMYAIAYPDEVLPIREMKIVVDIKPAWERVVKFCEWYNKQKAL